MTTHTRPDEQAAAKPARPSARGAALDRRHRLAGRLLLYAVAVLLSVWVLFPFYLITVTAFSPTEFVYDYPRGLVPEAVSAETMRFFAGAAGVLARCGTAWSWQ
jgi:ABC-type glycerol-3-phosphate transport system permease component